MTDTAPRDAVVPQYIISHLADLGLSTQDLREREAIMSAHDLKTYRWHMAYESECRRLGVDPRSET